MSGAFKQLENFKRGTLIPPYSKRLSQIRIKFIEEDIKCLFFGIGSSRSSKANKKGIISDWFDSQINLTHNLTYAPTSLHQNGSFVQ